jgi:dCMP deaminase
MTSEKWDRRFLQLAEHISTWSLDPSTQVGSVAVKERRVLATGYNGLPRGVADLPGRLFNREEKYQRIVHAEANIVAQAARFGIDLSGATIYVWPFLPCSNCTSLMIQAGIKRIVVPEIGIPERWQKNFDLSIEMLNEARVDLLQLSL